MGATNPGTKQKDWINAYDKHEEVELYDRKCNYIVIAVLCKAEKQTKGDEDISSFCPKTDVLIL